MSSKARSAFSKVRWKPAIASIDEDPQQERGRSCDFAQLKDLGLFSRYDSVLGCPKVLSRECWFGAQFPMGAFEFRPGDVSANVLATARQKFEVVLGTLGPFQVVFVDGVEVAGRGGVEQVHVVRSGVHQPVANKQGLHLQCDTYGNRDENCRVTDIQRK
ncbi:unnamed protein product [Notodromas monacha]|uniref:Uncharacterized protein n=1 Tax=Notodromas monacha TaxID=399045 RepID=A0A7R9BMQ9_9CRUS|nr:unnamed protein product [Notodromas monacha]CAG0918359.1 unnamed protein product [Notodromas monacha]